MKGLKPYLKYKDSGVKWLGEIPDHWEVKKLKHISSVQFSSVDKHTVDEENSVRLCNYTDVYNSDEITEAMDFMEASATRSEIERFRLKKGDVLITKDSESWEDIAVPAIVKSDMQDVLCGYHLAQIRAFQGISFGDYLFREFSSRGINDQYMVESTGVTRFGLGKYSLDNGLFAVPSIDEQKAITRFLDRETARIDSLIDKKQRLIELLKERRTELITQAVTKGLDPKVPMKDSGVEWLGEIPSHWQVMNLKRSAKIKTGTTPPSENYEYYDDGTVPWFTPGDFTDNLNLTLPSKLITEKALLDNKARIFPQFSIFLVSIGASAGRIGLISQTSSCNQQINSISFHKHIYPKYGAYFLKSLEHVIYALAPFSTLPIMDQDRTGNLFVLIPTIEEQHKISRFLDQETARIDSIIAKTTESIEKLKEYRSALISAAVTGKVDVRRGDFIGI